MIAESMQRESECTVFHGVVNVAPFLVSSKVQELERELNVFKAKFVTLLSDKFKVIVRGKLVYVHNVGLARRFPLWHLLQTQLEQRKKGKMLTVKCTKKSCFICCKEKVREMMYFTTSRLSKMNMETNMTGIVTQPCSTTCAGNSTCTTHSK